MAFCTPRSGTRVSKAADFWAKSDVPFMKVLESRKVQSRKQLSVQSEAGASKNATFLAADA